MGADDAPFRGSSAIAAGVVTEHQLYHDFVRLYQGVYISKRVEITAALRARAASLFAGPDAVLTGFSAAALHGSRWIDASEPAEVIRPGHHRATRKLIVHDCRLEPDEITVVDGIRVATAARAGFDLGRRLSRVSAIVALDALCNATGLKPAEVTRLAEQHPRARGLVRLRSILGEVDAGAESPPETHTRLAIVDAGLPPPETQIPIVENDGWRFACADLGWREWSVLVEYDGEHHWTDRRQRAWDIERSARIEALGWTVVRIGAELLYNRPDELVRRVRAKLRAAGAPV
ncbi:hypothetical protein ABIC28_002322 [Rhodococcus sp. PvR044]|uniref:DUF559 domain-containing protein n=1 Tax=Rhodococcus TaxID=1827 RepID=UPI0022B31789|nr:DUF559 domain-containing protein [Rhodococcus maanshanensis]MCZ4557220.1 DUF559 domain-containing protein [Rhodococcus maanshanensis]